MQNTVDGTTPMDDMPLPDEQSSGSVGKKRAAKAKRQSAKKMEEGTSGVGLYVVDMAAEPLQVTHVLDDAVSTQRELFQVSTTLKLLREWSAEHTLTRAEVLFCDFAKWNYSMHKTNLVKTTGLQPRGCSDACAQSARTRCF
jgi:hypothetical protein